MAVFRPVPAERNFPVLSRSPDGGGEPDPARIHPGELRKPFNEAEGLAAAVAAHQGVNLVDDDEPQVAEQPGDIGVFVKQQRLERFGRDLKNAGGILQKPLFAGLRDVAMPVPHRDIRLPAEVVEPLELIVDQRLQGADINRADGFRHIFGEQRQDGKEGGLGLPRRGGSGEQQVVVGVEHGVARGNLNGPQRLPVVLVDEIPDERRIAVEDIHRRPQISNSSNS